MKKYLALTILLVFIIGVINAQNISGIINNYQKITGIDYCSNSVTVTDSIGFSINDKVLLIQMKGAEIDTTNTISSGSIIDYGNAGNYEFAFISDIVGNEIFLRDSIIRMYNTGGALQLIRVPQFTNATVSDTLSCLPWDGNKGGVLVFEVSNTLTLNSVIDVSDKGFREGAKFVNSFCGGNCNGCVPPLYGHQYVRPNSGQFGIPKGEGIATLPDSLLGGLGTIGNGGGAAGSHPWQAGHNIAMINGGGGGGNFGTGGNGGNSLQWSGCVVVSGGLGGRSLVYSNAINRLFLGGGGGVGHHSNQSGGNHGPEFGTKGGGIIIIKANTILGNNNSILAYAEDITHFVSRYGGRSGGGAGGTVALDVQNYSGNLNINVKGGKGGDVRNSSNWKTGPGGGGGSGVIWLSNASVPANVSYNIEGGINGFFFHFTDTLIYDAWGATPGDSGAVLTGLSLMQTSNAMFVPVSQTTTITSNSPLCEGDDLVLISGTVPPGSLFYWSGPQGIVSTDQNLTITNVDSSFSGNYSLEIIVDGCPGPQVIESVYVGFYPDAPVTISDTVCFGNPLPSLSAIGNNLSWYADSNLTVLLSTDSAYIPNVNTIGTHIFYVTQKDSICEGSAAPIELVILPSPAPPSASNINICFGDSIPPFIANGNGIIRWYADSALTNLLTENDTLFSNETLPGVFNYFVTVFDTVYLCESHALEVSLYITPLPYANLPNDTVICEGDILTLNVDYNQNYPHTISWSTGESTQQITVSPSQPTTYTVTVDNGCGIALDSLTIDVNPIPIVTTSPDTAVCSGENLNISASGGTEYLWSNNLETTPVINITPLITTIYTVTVTNSFGCTANGNIVITALELPNITISGDTFICEGYSSTLYVAGGNAYVWSNMETTSSITVTPTSTITYSVTATLNNGCSSSEDVTIDVFPTFYIEIDSDFAPEHAILQGQQITFTAMPTHYEFYDFFVNNSLVQSGSSNTYTSASMGNNNILTVIGYQFDCSSIADSLTVKVKNLPNAFTPFDRDGVNEIFAKGLELTIINKWGQELYKGTDGWNGEYKGNRVSPGTYFYIIELNKNTPFAEILTGSITVVLKR